MIGAKQQSRGSSASLTRLHEAVTTQAWPGFGMQAAGHRLTVIRKLACINASNLLLYLRQLAFFDFSLFSPEFLSGNWQA